MLYRLTRELDTPWGGWKYATADVLAVSGVSKNPDTGYGRGAGENQKGYKFHTL